MVQASYEVVEVEDGRLKHPAKIVGEGEHAGAFEEDGRALGELPRDGEESVAHASEIGPYGLFALELPPFALRLDVDDVRKRGAMPPGGSQAGRIEGARVIGQDADGPRKDGGEDRQEKQARQRRGDANRL